MRLVQSFSAASNYKQSVLYRFFGVSEITRGMISAGCVVSLCANSSL